MTTGEQLKKTLNLEKFKYVYIKSLFGKSQKTYIIYYDSYMKNSKILNSEIKRSDSLQILKVSKDKVSRYKFTYPVLIEKFNARLSNQDVYFVVDIAGDYLAEKKKKIG